MSVASILVDTVVWNWRTQGRVVAVTWADGDWRLLVSVDGRLQTWLASSCTTAPPAPPELVPPAPHVRECLRPGCPCVAMKSAAAVTSRTSGGPVPGGPYCTCSNGCKRPECDRV